MNTITKARNLTEQHYKGEVRTAEFLHRLNREITVRADEPTVTYELLDGRWMLQTMDARVIPNVLNSDAVIDAREFDDNGFTRKLRAIITARELTEVVR
ncbi:hypothetical protein SAMN04487936_107207 [Halobacillus dabanensis]|uniref:Uncharacterized protein n=1 Tax=Halobacillus dabanensis TaxID=240302 RepID=A0A1I3WXZ9_HALDA|nr:hypothetical protein SAMN04487936_107207 [Halobacillus dabanensis]